MLKQTGPFLEWRLPLQALGGKEDRYGESYEVRRRMANGILPSLTPREDCYKGSKVRKERGTAKLHSKF